MAGEMDHDEESVSLGQKSEAEIRELMGMFDAPSFARRGAAMEQAISIINSRCRTMRAEMLDMVRLRLKQWSQATLGPDSWRGFFTEPIDHLWSLSGAPDPTWGGDPQNDRRRKAIAKDLAASVDRFNTRWTRHVNTLKLDLVNTLVQQYNTYYLLEKECVLGSARLASRFFQPQPFLSAGGLLRDHPLLPAVVVETR